MSVRLDTDEAAGECVNAVDAVISYPANIEPVDVSIGSSILNVWIEQPTINKTERTVTFAGGITNGYCGRVTGDPRLTNTLAQIVFRSPGLVVVASEEEDISKATIEFTDQTSVYLNDGFGTSLKPVTYPAKIDLRDRAGSQIKDDWRTAVSQDNIPPVEFSINGLEQYPNGDYYVTFSTTDKQTGIDHYEVMEQPISQFNSFSWGRADAPWVRVKQPPVHVLADQTLNSIVRVKAIDKAGNEYVATFIPDESKRKISTEEMYLVVFGFVLLVLLAAIIAVILWFVRRRKARKSVTSEDDLSDSNDVSLSNDDEIAEYEE